MVLHSDARNDDETLRFAQGDKVGFSNRSTASSLEKQEAHSTFYPRKPPFVILSEAKNPDRTLSRDPSLTLRVTGVEPVILSEAKNPDKTLCRDPSLRSG